jgi:catechol 2,3-dioxygenase-like lactoylglutathione lyase family enzyme
MKDVGEEKFNGVVSAMSTLTTITYLVREYDEAIAWFTHALDFQLIEDTDMGLGKRWVLVDAGGVRLLLAKADGPDQVAAIGKAAGGRVAYFLNTENFASTHQRMLAVGVKFREPPRREPYGTVAVFEDLYGNAWDLIEPKTKA